MSSYSRNDIREMSTGINGTFPPKPANEDVDRLVTSNTASADRGIGSSRRARETPRREQQQQVISLNKKRGGGCGGIKPHQSQRGGEVSRCLASPPSSSSVTPKLHTAHSQTLEFPRTVNARAHVMHGHELKKKKRNGRAKIIHTLYVRDRSSLKPLGAP